MWTDTIDQVLIINTNDDIGQQRLPLAVQELNKFSIPHKRHEAIKEREDGAAGLLQTMRILFEENPDQQILVFEDDLKFIRKDVNEIMELAIKQLPLDFDLLYLGCNLLMPPTRYSENLFQVRSAYSSHAVLYSAKAIERILHFWKKDRAYDQLLMENIHPFEKSFCVNPMLCVQRLGISAIFKYDPGRQIGIERFYNPQTNEMDWGAMMIERFAEFTKDL